MKQSISKLAIYTVVGLWALTSIPSQAAPVSSKTLERIEFNETSLETAIEYVMNLRQVDYQSLIKKYDWGEMASTYDKAFNALVK